MLFIFENDIRINDWKILIIVFISQLLKDEFDGGKLFFCLLVRIIIKISLAFPDDYFDFFMGNNIEFG